MLQRTAADIVGVPNTKITVREVSLNIIQPHIKLKEGDEIDQFTIAKDETFR